MVRVVSIIKPIWGGITHPFFALLQEGNESFIAVIKLKGNPEGVRCLVNEFISFRLAVALGVLMPQSGVAKIDNSTIDNTGYASLEENIGSCFFSKQIQPALTLNERIMQFIDNKEMYEKVIVFDHLIYNPDRNPGNLLLSGKKKEKVLYAIDHSHVFKNQAIWDAFSLKRGIEEDDYLDDSIINGSKSYELFSCDKPMTALSLMKVANDFQKKCNVSLLNRIISDLPSDWAIDKTDLNELKNYIIYRSLHLIDICRMIVKTREWKNE